MKRFTGIFIAIVLSMAAVVGVYSHCHTTYPCEQVIYYLVDGAGQNQHPRHWIKPNRNEVDYHINPDYTNMPSLLEDVKEAAKKWDNIDVGNNQHIKFNLNVVDESSSLTPHVPDNKNVIGWKCLKTKSKNPLATTRKWVNQKTGEIVEADIAFNYYRSFKKHGTGTSNDGKTCIRDVAMHEWGHFAGLEHVTYTGSNPGIGNCEAWKEYTMHTSRGPNTHGRETIECEDKFALEHIYGK